MKDREVSVMQVTRRRGTVKSTRQGGRDAQRGCGESLVTGPHKGD